MSQEARTLVCSFGTKSTGKAKMSIAIQIDRAEIGVGDLVELLVDAQLEAELSANPEAQDDLDGQQALIETPDIRLAGIAEAHSLQVGGDKYGARLTFAKSALGESERSALDELAGKTGKVTLLRVGDVGGDDED